ncbi:AAA family ATPase [Novosphingobium resinovorum]|uniref:AAA family ATPase n=1 Tax=Novosphingobium resinovorum TaxID=158500 RepID=UPI002ED23484|nr:AAA family ATPase [Novosphingobium resinovorum]
MSGIAIRATIVHVLFSTAQMSVFRADDHLNERRRFVARDLPRPPAVGECWHVHGSLADHPIYGPQIEVAEMRVVRPEGRFLPRLLAGDRFTGVGEASANKLWDALGDRLIEVIEAADRSTLRGVLGDTPRARAQVETILLEWPGVAAEPQIFAALDKLGVPNRIACKLIDVYGTDAAARVENDPYRLLSFASWKVVEEVARSVGVGIDDPRRLAAACEMVLHRRLASGDTLLPEIELRKRVRTLLGQPSGSDPLEAADRLLAVRRRKSGWQASGPALMEEAVATRIAREIAAQPASGKLLPLALRKEGGFPLTANQGAAVTMAINSSFSLLAGGAGTGKTTVLKSICEAASANGIAVEMMALSGRAALRIREATGLKAWTIASWLVGVEAGHVDLSSSPLIIIDEASMVDLGSLYRILVAAPTGCRFLLVGDDGQLPPVGFGLTFHALLQVEGIPRTMLTEVMRQAAQTGIPSFAQSVRDGALPHIQPYRRGVSAGVTLLECSDAMVAAVAVDVRRNHPGAQIVGSIKGGGGAAGRGTMTMNGLLRDAWAISRGLDATDWIPGEPVIWTVNDYELELWNGSLGKVIRRKDTALIVKFDDGERHIPGHLLEHLESAWAITTHKAQGSQFDTVIVPVVRSRIMDRTLLYTAVTRAKHQVILVGDFHTIQEIVAGQPKALARRTWLIEALALGRQSVHRVDMGETADVGLT